MVYLKYWTLNLRALMVYPKVLFPPYFYHQRELQYLPGYLIKSTIMV